MLGVSVSSEMRCSSVAVSILDKSRMDSSCTDLLVVGSCSTEGVTIVLDDEAADLMVFPGYKAGSVQILNLATTEQKVSSAPVTINAHQNELCCLAINQQGTMMATASVKGNIF